MKGLFILLTSVFFLHTAAQHSFQVGYTGGFNVNFFRFASPGPAKYSMHNCASFAYQYMSDRKIGVVVGLDVSGYKTNPADFTPGRYVSYMNVQQTYVYLSTPVMMQVMVGKKKNKFIFNSGVVVNYAIWYNLTYQGGGEGYTSITRTYLEPLQIGIPVGLGAHIPVSEKLYMNVMLENRFYIPDIRRNTRVDGLLNSIGLKLVLGINHRPATP